MYTHQTHQTTFTTRIFRLVIQLDPNLILPNAVLCFFISRQAYYSAQNVHMSASIISRTNSYMNKVLEVKLAGNEPPELTIMLALQRRILRQSSPIPSYNINLSLWLIVSLESGNTPHLLKERLTRTDENISRYCWDCVCAYSVTDCSAISCAKSNRLSSIGMWAKTSQAARMNDGRKKWCEAHQNDRSMPWHGGWFILTRLSRVWCPMLWHEGCVSYRRAAGGPGRWYSIRTVYRHPPRTASEHHWHQLSREYRCSQRSSRSWRRHCSDECKLGPSSYIDDIIRRRCVLMSVHIRYTILLS